jgi:predicted  nucleic acid-binding Zn-ribbon protein
MGDAEDRLWGLLESTLEDIKRSIKDMNRKLDTKLDRRDLEVLSNAVNAHDKRLDKLEEEADVLKTERHTIHTVEARAVRWRKYTFEAAMSLASTAALVIAIFHP